MEITHQLYLLDMDLIFTWTTGVFASMMQLFI